MFAAAHIFPHFLDRVMGPNTLDFTLIPSGRTIKRVIHLYRVVQDALSFTLVIKIKGGVWRAA